MLFFFLSPLHLTLRIISSPMLYANKKNNEKENEDIKGKIIEMIKLLQTNK